MSTNSKTRVSYERTPLTALEQGLVAKMARASYPPATASKRFVRDLSSGFVKQLSINGRRFLAFIAYRFRRQYRLTAEEQAWVDKFLAVPKEQGNERDEVSAVLAGKLEAHDEPDRCAVREGQKGLFD